MGKINYEKKLGFSIQQIAEIRKKVLDGKATTEDKITYEDMLSRFIAVWRPFVSEVAYKVCAESRRFDLVEEAEAEGLELLLRSILLFNPQKSNDYERFFVYFLYARLKMKIIRDHLYMVRIKSDPAKSVNRVAQRITNLKRALETASAEEKEIIDQKIQKCEAKLLDYNNVNQENRIEELTDFLNLKDKAINIDSDIMFKDFIKVIAKKYTPQVAELTKDWASGMTTSVKELATKYKIKSNTVRTVLHKVGKDAMIYFYGKQR
jgi:hypothetical protein